MAQYPGSSPAPAPRRSNRNLFLILGCVAILACTACVGVSAVFGGSILAAVGIATAAPADVTGRYMTAIKNSDWQTAYNLCGEDLQDEIGSVKGMEDFIIKNRVQPTDWTFNSTNVTGGRAEFKGNATFTGSRKGIVEIVLQQESGTWKVTGIRLREN